MTAYYNEIDPFAAQWLRNLIAAGHIAPGFVDERSIEDVSPDDLREFTQCHFFAGIGVWSLALRRAGWSDNRPVWTGSCPCQPFSAAGAGVGFDDQRHLWPLWFHLVSVLRPSVVFGEQVEAAIRHGWLDLVQADLEGIDYAFAAVGFPSSGVGAPHIRQRLWFVGNANNKGLEGFAGHDGAAGRERQDRPATATSVSGGVAGLLWNPGPVNGFWRNADWLLCRDGKWRPVEPGTFPLAHGATQRVGRLRAYGNAINAEAAQTFIEAYLDEN